MKLDVKALALAAGTLWGLAVLLLGWFGWTGIGAKIVDALGSVYLGYSPTFIGGILGGLWAFFDGLVTGALFGWIYNGLCGAARASRPSV